MFAFKVVAAVISVLVCLGVYNKLTEKNRSVKNVLVAVIIFGVFAFFVNRLINGDRVLKNARPAQDRSDGRKIAAFSVRCPLIILGSGLQGS